MKQFVLNGDVVKRLLYNKPIINEDYTHNNTEYDFTNWNFNNNQPSEGITITKGKIVITKFKPNEPIIISNFTGDAANNSPTIENICSISKELKINLKGVSANNNIFGADKAYNNTNILAGGTIGYIYGLGFLPYKTTYREGRPLEKWGEMPFSCYVWGNIILVDNSTVQIASEVNYLRSDVQGAYNRYGKINNYTNKQIFPNWRTWYGHEEGTWYDTDFQLSIGLYTNVSPDANGFIELDTPVEISLINNSVVDPTTQEAFKLYNKNELLYERDRTVENLYKSFNLLKNDTQTYKSSWQKEKEDNDGETFDGNVAYIFTIEDYDYQKISLPVATDLVQKIQEFVPFKFNITQYDYGRNEFWKTVVQTINSIQEITDYTFCCQLFKNAIGLAELDWNTIGDQTLHGIVINIGPNNQYFVVDECFAYCDIPAVTINDAGGTLKAIHDLFKYSSVKHIKFGAGIVLHDIIGAFEAARSLEDITGLTVINVLSLYNGKYLSDRTLAIAYSFEGAGLENLNIDGEDIIVYPYCPQVFGSSCGLKTITGSAFDFKFVDPADIVNWGVVAWYGHQIFGNSILESIKIKNLNKGNWTIPMPLNNTSVNYLLNNIYDLTSNDGEHLERDDNSFNGWTHSYTNQESHKTIKFNHGHYAQIIKTNWNGRKIFKLKASVATQISLMLKDQGTIVLNQQFNIGTSETVIDRSANTFDEVRIGINLQNSQDDIDLTLSDPFDSAASNTTSATLTFSQVQYDSEFDAAIAVAQARGWTIQFAS